MEFGEIASRIFALHGEGKLEAAVDLIDRKRHRLPDHRNDLVFWEACLLAQLGRIDESIASLESAVDEGEWWPPDQLLDPDLDPIRSDPRWEQVEVKCAARAVARRRRRPRPLVRTVAEPEGTMVVVQGARAVHQEVADVWLSSAPPLWNVVVPCASEPTPVGEGWQWSRSNMARNLDVVFEDVAELVHDQPLVLAGFSIGTAIACDLATGDRLPAAGLIAIAPSSFGDFPELRSIAANGPPLLVICGSEDPRVERYRNLETDIGSLDTVIMSIIPGLAHEVPPDLGNRVTAFLSEVRGQSND